MKLILSRPIKLIALKISFLFLLVGTAFNCFALNKFSHQLVCQLSYQNLSHQQQTTISQLFTHLSPQQTKLINQYNHRKANEPITFAKACTWADAIKKLTAYDYLKPWHYLNVARDTKMINAHQQGAYCQQGCITNAINVHFNQFKNAKNKEQKLSALMLLGHWLGDIHQPLHISFASDYGGNNIKINSKSKCKNLHRYWDQCLIPSTVKNYQRLLLNLQKQWPATNVEFKLGAQWLWANETFQITTAPALSYCQYSDNGCISQNKPLTLTPAYQKLFQPILEQQLLSAAIRLNSLLNELIP
ncbi:MAG: S1/P1 nuclease [Thalassotalea sp.]